MFKKIIKYSIGFVFSTNLIFLTCLSENLRNDQQRLNEVNIGKSEILNIDYLKKLDVNDYIIGPGDTIYINVSDDYPELRTIKTIDAEGRIMVPKLKRIYVKGLNLIELDEILNKAYKKFIYYPSVTTEIIKYRPIKILVKGEVNSPGYKVLKGSLFQNIDPMDLNFQINENTDNFENQSLIEKTNLGNISSEFPTLFDAIKNSGGITTYSDLSNIEIIRKSSISKGGGQKKAIVDFTSFLIKGNSTQNIRIFDGDKIKIKKLKKELPNSINYAIQSSLNPKFIKVFVGGRVKLPGSVTLIKSATLNDAIDLSGGTKIFKGKVKYLSFNNDGSIDKRNIRYDNKSKRGSQKNPFLKNGDLIYVGNSFLSNSTEVIKELTDPIQGIYSTYRLIELLTD